MKPLDDHLVFALDDAHHQSCQRRHLFLRPVVMILK